MSNQSERPTALRLTSLALLALLALFAVSCSSDDVDDTLDATESTIDSVVDDVDDQVDDVDSDDVDDAQDTLAATLESLGLTSLSTAVAGIEIDDLTDADEFTFFAPNDEAFTSMTADELADLLADPELLADVLRNHVVEERIDSTQLADRASVTSVIGNDLSVTQSDGSIMVAGATVVQADQAAGDGVIHVVDRLILPS